MEGLGYYEDLVGRQLIRLAKQNQIKMKKFTFFPQQREQSRCYYKQELSLTNRESLLREKISLYTRAIEIHSNRAYSADYLEALIYLSIVRAKRMHPQLQITISPPS